MQDIFAYNFYLNRQRVEEALCELEERYKHLEEKSNQLCDLAEKNKDFTITGKKDSRRLKD